MQGQEEIDVCVATIMMDFRRCNWNKLYNRIDASGSCETHAQCDLLRGGGLLFTLGTQGERCALGMPLQFDLPAGALSPAKSKSSSSVMRSAKSLALGDGPLLTNSSREASARARAQTTAASKEALSKLQKALADDTPAAISIDQAPILGEEFNKVMDDTRGSEITSPSGVRSKGPVYPSHGKERQRPAETCRTRMPWWGYPGFRIAFMAQAAAKGVLGGLLGALVWCAHYSCAHPSNRAWCTPHRSSANRASPASLRNCRKSWMRRRRATSRCGGDRKCS